MLLIARQPDGVQRVLYNRAVVVTVCGKEPLMRRATHVCHIQQRQAECIGKLLGNHCHVPGAPAGLHDQISRALMATLPLCGRL